jgi:hypothetical protein
MPPIPPPPTDKKYFTVADANAMLPLVRSIVRDIVELDQTIRGWYDRPCPADAEQAEAELEQLYERMREFERELVGLGVELKGHREGLVDFPGWFDGREVCLCWKYGEADLGFWHETDAGFAGRRRLGQGHSPR